MTAEEEARISISSGTICPRFCKDIVPHIEEGAGKAGCPEHPRPVCIGSKHTVVTTVAPEITRLSPRNGFNGFLRALLGDEFLFVTVTKRIDGDLTRLGRFRLRKASISNGCQDHTTSPYAATSTKALNGPCAVR